VDVGSPVEVFCQPHIEVLGLLDLSKNLAMEGVVSDRLLFVETFRMWQQSTLNHLAGFLPVFKFIQVFMEYVGVSLGLDFVL